MTVDMDVTTEVVTELRPVNGVAASTVRSTVDTVLAEEEGIMSLVAEEEDIMIVAVEEDGVVE